MFEHHELSNRHLDDLLAEFTDRILSLEDVERVSLSTQDPELRALEETALLLRKVVGAQRPSKALSERIRANLITEWQGLEVSPRQRFEVDQRLTRNWWRKLGWRPNLRTRRTLALGLVSIVAILVVAVLFFSPEVGSNLTGMASGQASLIAIILVLVIAAAAVIYWILTSRR